MISTIKNIRAASLSERDLVAKKLLNKIPPTDCSAPAELQSLMSKEYVFKLSRNKYNTVDGRQNYGVSAVYVPLQELESAYAEKSMPQVSVFFAFLDNKYVYFRGCHAPGCPRIRGNFSS